MMHGKKKAFQIIILLLVVLFTVSGCTEIGEAQRIPGSAYARVGDGAPINWHSDIKHSFALNEAGILTISYSGDDAENDRTAELDLSAVAGIGYETIGLYIAGEKTAIAYGGATQSDPVAVAVSNDRGATWQHTAVDFTGTTAGAKHVSFATAEIGWLIISEPYAAKKEDHHLYTTADGGVTWNAVESNLAMKVNGSLTGIGAMSEKVAAVGLSSKTPFEAGAAFTNDGGETWYRLFITAPSEYSEHTKMTLPPIASGNTLIMPLVLTDENGETETFYMQSSNAGESWKNEENRKIRLSIDVNEFCDT